MATIILLIFSNIFMTFAWYGHLKYQNVPLWKVTLASWGLAFFRILLSGPRQPDRQPHFQRRAAQDDPGNHHPGGVFVFLHLVSERGHQVELRGGIFLYRGGGVFYF